MKKKIVPPKEKNKKYLCEECKEYFGVVYLEDGVYRCEDCHYKDE